MSNDIGVSLALPLPRRMSLTNRARTPNHHPHRKAHQWHPNHNPDHARQKARPLNKEPPSVRSTETQRLQQNQSRENQQRTSQTQKATETLTGYDLGPPISNHYALLHHTIDTHQPTGTALEFGVATGESLHIIAAHMPTIGFDSFTGLPENWRNEYPAGTFACPPPTIPNTRLVIGLFEDTLPTFQFPNDIGLVHIDCDLYSSTSIALKYVLPHLHPGCHIIFDEFHGFDGCEDHEQRAWREHSTGLNWHVTGHGHEAWSIQLA